MKRHVTHYLTRVLAAVGVMFMCCKPEWATARTALPRRHTLRADVSGCPTPVPNLGTWHMLTDMSRSIQPSPTTTTAHHPSCRLVTHRPSPVFLPATPPQPGFSSYTISLHLHIHLYQTDAQAERAELPSPLGHRVPFARRRPSCAEKRAEERY